MAQARVILNEAGLKNRTLISEDGGVRVLIYDPEGKLLETVHKYADEKNIDIEYYPGTGEFLGPCDTREAGRDVFREVIQRALSPTEAGQASTARYDPRDLKALLGYSSK